MLHLIRAPSFANVRRLLYLQQRYLSQSGEVKKIQHLSAEKENTPCNEHLLEKIIPDDATLQQFYDQQALRLTPEQIRETVKKTLGIYGTSKEVISEQIAFLRWKSSPDYEMSHLVAAKEKDSTQSLNIILSHFRSFLSNDGLTSRLESTLSKMDRKDLTALGNLIFQYSSDFKPLALAFYEIGVNSQERNALFSYGQILRSGVLAEVGQNTNLAASMFQKASEAEHPYASYNLGLMYFTGEISSNPEGSGPDYTRAFIYLEKAANQGVELAWTNLGNMYYHGLGIQPNFNKALDLFNKAAVLGDPKANLALGNIYAKGGRDCRDPDALQSFRRNPFKAFQYWHHAAQGAFKLTDGMQLAAENVDHEVAALSLYNLGNCFFLGVGLPDNPRLSDDDGFGCSGLEEESIYSRPNYPLAMEYWKSSTEQMPGFLLPWLHLGNMYMDGMANTTQKPDDSMAMHYYSRLLIEGEKMGVWSSSIETALNEENTSKDMALDHEPVLGQRNTEICLMASSLLKACQRRLDPNDPSHAEMKENSKGKVTDSAFFRLLDDAQKRKRSTKKSNKSWWVKYVSPFKDPDVLEDFEQQEIDKVGRRDYLNKLREDAVRYHWKYVEEFAHSLKQS